MSGEELKTVYYIFGFLVITNIGTVITVLFSGFKLVYNYAVLVTTVKALHDRLDRIEGGRDERKKN